jgi:hypothetical protein
VTDRDRVVAEPTPPRAGRSEVLADAMLAEVVRRGWVVPPVLTSGTEVRAPLAHVGLIELAPRVLSRALESFPVSLRTLDALHLASIEFLRGHGQTVELATYDERMLAAARTLRIPLFAP